MKLWEEGAVTPERLPNAHSLLPKPENITNIEMHNIHRCEMTRQTSTGNTTTIQIASTIALRAPLSIETIHATGIQT